MAVETYNSGSRPDVLNDAWPLGSDVFREGDNHLRLLKTVVKNAYTDLEDLKSEFTKLKDSVPSSDSLGTASGLNVGTGKDDIPQNKNLGSAAYKDAGDAAGEVPILDAAGLIPVARIPTGTTANKILKLDGAGKLPSLMGVTPPSSSNSDLLATTAFVKSVLGDKPSGLGATLVVNNSKNNRTVTYPFPSPGVYIMTDGISYSGVDPITIKGIFLYFPDIFPATLQRGGSTSCHIACNVNSLIVSRYSTVWRLG